MPVRIELYLKSVFKGEGGGVQPKARLTKFLYCLAPGDSELSDIKDRLQSMLAEVKLASFEPTPGRRAQRQTAEFAHPQISTVEVNATPRKQVKVSANPPAQPESRPKTGRSPRNHKKGDNKSKQTPVNNNCPISKHRNPYYDDKVDFYLQTQNKLETRWLNHQEATYPPIRGPETRDDSRVAESVLDKNKFQTSYIASRNEASYFCEHSRFYCERCRQNLHAKIKHKGCRH